MSNWAVEQGFLTAFNFIGFVLVLVPLVWHLEGKQGLHLLCAPCPHTLDCSLEYWVYPVHLLDRHHMSNSVYQPYNVEG